MQWDKPSVTALYDKPFMDLLYQAQTVHRNHFAANQVQISILLNIKTGGCPEKCDYCRQSAHFDTGLKRQPLLSVEEVLAAAHLAKQQGATRFCLAAAWRSPPVKDFPQILKMLTRLKGLEMEICMTLGMLSDQQAQALADAGLDYYNHNLDTSPEYYARVIGSRSLQDRLDTLAHLERAGIKICCGGLIGMGETRADRISLLVALANLSPHAPHSVPMNMLIPMSGTPLEKQQRIDPFEFIRAVACARIVMPKSYIRLTGGRNEMNDEMHALAFLAGANSMHVGQLLTSPLPDTHDDYTLLARLNMQALTYEDLQQEETRG
jgi:biotin synthase